MLLQLLVRSLEPRAQPRTQKGSCLECGSSGARSHLQHSSREAELFQLPHLPNLELRFVPRA